MTREEAIKILNEEKDFQNTLVDKSVFNAICIAVEALKQTERPTARWIESPNGVYVECSICGSHWEKGFVEHCNMQYCPKCGARMEGIA